MKTVIKKDKNIAITISDINIKKIKSGLIEFWAHSADDRFKSSCKLYINEGFLSLQTDTDIVKLTPGGESMDQIREEYDEYREILCGAMAKGGNLMHKEVDKWLSENRRRFFVSRKKFNIRNLAIRVIIAAAKAASYIKYNFKKLCKIS